jgi:hypothetical protein
MLRFWASPETEKAQPELTDGAWFLDCGGMGAAAYRLKSSDAFHLLSTLGGALVLWMGNSPFIGNCFSANFFRVSFFLRTQFNLRQYDFGQGASYH